MESSYAAFVVTTITHDPRLTCLAITLLSLSIWRLLIFTVIPYFYPKDPKEYPYWVPFVGHLHSFFKNSSQLVSEARLYFHDAREPFALTVAGQKWYVLTKAEDVASTYKINDGSLSYDIFAIEVMRMVGISEDGISKAFQTCDVDQDEIRAVPYKHLVRLCKEYQLEQLSPGDRFAQLIGPAIEWLGLRMDIEWIHSREWYVSPIGQGCVNVSLYQWLSDIFISLGTTTYFGRSLEEIDPSHIRTFTTFESLSWQAMYQYPGIFCGEMARAKVTLQNTMAEYFELPKDRRVDASWFIFQIEKEMNRLKISLTDRAIFFFQLYWSINGNTRKAPFWMLSYLLFDESLIETIRAETECALDGNDVNVAYLLDVQKCPQLNSIWDETIRLTAFAASVRFLTRDIELGGKVLRKGNRIIMPQRQLHFSERAFGENATQFEPDRFLKNPALRRNSSLRPFGGGATMCPGRNLAKQMTLVFIAIALNRFDISLNPPNQAFPRPAEGKPSIGLVDMQDGCDIQVKLSARI
ncbi:cytochrome P450 [Hypoxylon sp. FL1857]|nr:cytochrome P450 [Hypoxylon sp. FL1857]